MALGTHSAFYYGYEVTSDNQYINFKEGAGAEKTAVVPVGTYSLTKLLQVISAALNAASAIDWAVTVDRTTRIVTIVSDSTASLLFATGTNAAQSIYALIGHASADVLNVISFVGTLPSGTAYRPQFKLQDYKDNTMTRKLVNPTVNKSSSKQKVSVQYFGVEEFFKFNIKYITNRDISGSDLQYKNNPSAVEEVKAFLNYIILKNIVEFMPDENTPSVFFRMYLDSSAQDNDGTGFDLIEYVDRDAPNFFETGLLTFTVVTQE